MDIDFSIRALKLSANQAMVISCLVGMAFSWWWPDWHPTTGHHTGIHLDADPHVPLSLPNVLTLVLMGIILKCSKSYKAKDGHQCRRGTGWYVGESVRLVYMTFSCWHEIFIPLVVQLMSMFHCFNWLVLHWKGRSLQIGPRSQWGEKGYNHIFLSGHPYLSSLVLCWPSLTLV